MGNTQSKQRNIIISKASQVECYICMNNVSDDNLIIICQNKHSCCMDCKETIKQQWKSKIECPFCRAENGKYIRTYTNDNNYDEQVEYVRTLYRKALGTRIAILHVKDNSKLKGYNKKKPMQRFGAMLQRFGIHERLAYDVYWYENNIGLLKNCEEFVRYTPINKWTKEECKWVTDSLEYDMIDLIDELMSQFSCFNNLGF